VRKGYDGRMSWRDEPTGRFGVWGQVASVFVTFAILWFLLVEVLLNWVIGASDLILGLASLPIAAFAIVWGFTEAADEADGAVVTESELANEVQYEWIVDRPEGFWGWCGRLALFLVGWSLVARALYWLAELLFNVPDWTRFVIVAICLPPLLALEFLDQVEKQEPTLDSPDSAHPATSAYRASK